MDVVVRFVEQNARTSRRVGGLGDRRVKVWIGSRCADTTTVRAATTAAAKPTKSRKRMGQCNPRRRNLWARCGRKEQR